MKRYFIPILLIVVSFLTVFIAYGRTGKIDTFPKIISNGLIGYWTFDGKNLINNVTDSSGGGNNGSLVGFGSTSTSVVSGEIGQALRFNGIGTNINAGGSSNFNFTSGDFGISFWMRADSGKTGGIISRSSGGGTVDGWAINWEVSNIRVRTKQAGGANQETVSGKLTVGKWNQVVISRRGSSVKIYVNGAENDPTSVAHTDPVTAAANLLIGRDLNKGYFQGSLDDVRIYNRALSIQEAVQLYQSGLNKIGLSSDSDPSLIGWWTMDGKDVATGAAIDSSGNGNTGYFVGMSTTSMKVAGKIGQGYYLIENIASKGLSMGNVLNMGTSDFTISGWFKRTKNSGGEEVFIAKTDTLTGIVGQGWKLYFGANPNDIRFGASDGTNSDIFIYTPQTNTNKWIYIAISWRKGSDPVFYVNGTVNACAASCASSQFPLIGSVSNAFNFTVGTRTNTTGAIFWGSLDDMRIYQRALSTAEIRSLYLSGTTKLNK